ncbi:MAG: hypothetical protein ACLS48_10760 [[Eubacterium] siraeum]
MLDVIRSIRRLRIVRIADGKLAHLFLADKSGLWTAIRLKQCVLRRSLKTSSESIDTVPE